MLQKVKQYYDYEIDFNSLKVDECEFHPDTLLPKSLIYKKFDLLPKIDKLNVWTFSSKEALLEENSEGKYTGILNREKLLYQNIKTIETHKFHINNEIRNAFSNPDNIDTFERVTKNYYNTIKFIVSNPDICEPRMDDTVNFKNFIKKYDNIIKLINEAISLAKSISFSKKGSYEEYSEKTSVIASLMKEVVETDLIKDVNTGLYGLYLYLDIVISDADMVNLKIMNLEYSNQRQIKIIGFVCQNIKVSYKGETLYIKDCVVDAVFTESEKANKFSMVYFDNNKINNLNFGVNESLITLLYFNKNKINTINSLQAPHIFFEDNNFINSTSIPYLKTKKELSDNFTKDYFLIKDTNDYTGTIRYVVENYFNNRGLIEDIIRNNLNEDHFMRLPNIMSLILRNDLSGHDIIEKYEIKDKDGYEFIYKLINLMLK